LIGHFGRKKNNRQEIDERRQVVEIKRNKTGVILKGYIVKTGTGFKKIVITTEKIDKVKKKVLMYFLMMYQSITFRYLSRKALIYSLCPKRFTIVSFQL